MKKDYCRKPAQAELYESNIQDGSQRTRPTLPPKPKHEARLEQLGAHGYMHIATVGLRAAGERPTADTHTAGTKHNTAALNQ